LHSNVRIFYNNLIKGSTEELYDPYITKAARFYQGDTIRT